MARSVKPEKILESLKKLYEKRTVLDKQILEVEKSFIAATSVAPAGKAATGNKSTPSPRKKAPARKPAKK
jgi:hypothetical protein